MRLIRLDWISFRFSDNLTPKFTDKMASAASGTGDVFEKFAKFGKTESQVKEMKGGLRMETRNVQKLMKESGVIDAKYSTQLLDNDISKHLDSALFRV